MMGKLLLLLANFVATSLAIQCLSTGDHLIGKLCYRLIDQQLTYADARNWCHYKNPVTYSYLASVTDLYTANFLASYATTTFSTNEGYFWIGLSRPNTSSPYQWDDGQPVVWTNLQVTVAQNYVAESIANGKWRNYGPDTKLRFACSYDPSNTDPVTTAEPTSTAVTPTDAAGNCDPKSSNSTFLFGYSTELSPNVVTWVTEQIVNVMLKDSRNYKNYANVRLDNKNGIESIHSHSDIFAFSSEVNKNLPNPNLAYPSPDNQTDLFGIIRNFINSPAFTLCGSRLFFLLHRLPQADSGADRIIDYQKLIENDVQIFLIKSRDGDGGIMNPLYRLAANTSGLLSYAVQSSFPMVAGSFLDAPYRDDLLFSYNSSDMKKNGTYYLGTLKVPESSDPTVNLTLAITTEMSPGNQFLISFDLILENKSSGVNQTLSYNRSDEVGYSDLIYRDIELDSGAVSEVYATIYNTWYSIINVRIYIAN